MPVWMARSTACIPRSTARANWLTGRRRPGIPARHRGRLIVGGEYGEGSLRSHSSTVGYYSTAQASVGLTAGGQSKAIIIMFMTPEAYNKFVSSKGWTAGADANVAIAKVGANGQLDTLTSQQPVVGFVQTNAGLMFDVSINGAKVSKLDI